MRCYITLMLFFLMCTYVQAHEYEEIELPARQARLRIVDANGEDLIKPQPYKFEFGLMKVKTHKDPNSRTGYYQPKNRCEALKEFKTLLPENYFYRLDQSYVEDTPSVGGIADAAVNERLYDVEDFLVKNWELRRKNNIYHFGATSEPLDLIWFLMSVHRSEVCE